jgi:hypothetical protein
MGGGGRMYRNPDGSKVTKPFHIKGLPINVCGQLVSKYSPWSYVSITIKVNLEATQTGKLAGLLQECECLRGCVTSLAPLKFESQPLDGSMCLQPATFSPLEVEVLKGVCTERTC